MPVFEVTIRVRDDVLIGDQEWAVNTHVNESGTSDQAWEDANELAEALVGTVLPESCHVFSISIRNPDVVNGNQTRAVDLVGTRTVTGSTLPQWNVALVQMRAAAGTRPSTFHLRMGLTENDVAGQLLEAATVSAVNDLITAWLAQGNMCNPSGALFESGGVNDLVFSRQMAWHRRSRPGFHRGWVPNA